MSDEISVWIELLRNVGFPIVLAAYLLLRFERKIRKLADIITELKQAILKNKD